MFISPEDIQHTFQDAHVDLRVFLNAWLNEGQFRLEWLGAQSEAVECEGYIPEAVTNANDFGEFIEPFLVWLEQTAEQPTTPWETDARGEPYLPTSSNCRVFLGSLLYNLQNMIEPSDQDGTKIACCDNQPSHVLQNFARFTSERQNCTLSFNDISWSWGNFPGFVSWLVVFPNENELHIVSNEAIIEASSRETVTLARRFEKVFLHELGHARTNFEHYLTAPAPNGVVYARPEHETRAWLYAYALLAYISSARSRISRLLRIGDSEWR